MPDLVPGAGIRDANKADKNTCPQEDAILVHWHSTHLNQTISPPYSRYQTPCQESGVATGEEWGNQTAALPLLQPYLHPTLPCPPAGV